MESCSLTIKRTESDSNLTSSIPQNRILEAVDVPAGLFFLRVLQEHRNRAARTISLTSSYTVSAGRSSPSMLSSEWEMSEDTIR